MISLKYSSLLFCLTISLILFLIFFSISFPVFSLLFPPDMSSTSPLHSSSYSVTFQEASLLCKEDFRIVGLFSYNNNIFYCKIIPLSSFLACQRRAQDRRSVPYDDNPGGKFINTRRVWFLFEKMQSPKISQKQLISFRIKSFFLKPKDCI